MAQTSCHLRLCLFFFFETVRLENPVTSLLPSVKALLQRMKTSPRFPRKLPSTHSWSCGHWDLKHSHFSVLENHGQNQDQICYTCFKRAILLNSLQKIPRRVLNLYKFYISALTNHSFAAENVGVSPQLQVFKITSSVFKICKFMYWSMDFRVPLYSIPDVWCA